MLYNPPTGSADPNAPYIGKNVAAGIQGSRIPPKAVEATQREILAPIVAAGLSPTNDDLQQLLRAIRSGVLSYFADTGGANTLVIAPNPSHTAYVSGLTFRVRVAASNTGPATLNVNGIGPRAIVRVDGSPLKANDLLAGEIATLIFDGASTSFQVAHLNPNHIPFRSTTVFDTPGTYSYTPPGIVGGFTPIEVELWGGGGGGGGTNASGGVAAGGGAGGYSRGIFVVPAAVPLSAIVGARGFAGPTTPGNGGNGGTSSVGALISATGGAGGGGYNGAGVNVSVAAGGVGVGGQLNAQSGSGGTGYNVSSIAAGGPGGAAQFGGPPPTQAINSAGQGGYSPGGGAQGGVNGNVGGLGGAGLIIIRS